MFGIGSSEAVVILVVVVLLFAPTLVAFWLGYNLGQRRVPTDRRAPAAPADAPGAEAGPAAGTEQEGGAADE